MMDLPLRYILTVSELTQEIKDILELKFPDVWVEGEISNLRIPPSGHLYFTLKDDFSQIRAVLFKIKVKSLRFIPEDGLQVICRGRVSLYEKRGEYQLILEEIEPKGIGALQLAFLQLKDQLEKEGLFDISHKKRIPMVPQSIGIITSPTGAVIQDMLHIIHRRFENVHILIYPVQVQGEGASIEIAQAIKDFNQWMNVDVIILGRGGGALEDLWPFNEERVARAIYKSKIPIISAVGHETDYTISDFVADLRAPTPSAAAELVIKDKREIKNTLHYLQERLCSHIIHTLKEHQTHILHLRKSLIDPRKKIEEYLLRVDDLVNRFQLLSSWILKRKRERTLHLSERLYLQNPIPRIKKLVLHIFEVREHLEQTMGHLIEIQRHKIAKYLGKLESLSPLSVLQRGYSITRKLPSLEILRDVAGIKEGDKVEVKLYKGSMLCGVEKTKVS